VSASDIEAKRLRSYDIILVNSSAGKDSQAMLTHIVGLADAAGVRDRLVVVHCDLGRVEWKGTRELAEEQARHYGIRFEAVSRPQGDLLTQIEKRGMFPSSTARYCTSDHKRGQVATLLTKLAGEHRAKGNAAPVRILNCLGLRADESPARAKKVPFETDKRASNGRRHVDVWLPIHDWTVERVWKVIRASGVRYHYAYDLGMPRLSCCFCIFAPDAALMLAGKHNGALLAEYVRVETKIGHAFKIDRGQKIHLRVIQERLAAGEEPNTTGLQSWCM